MKIVIFMTSILLSVYASAQGTELVAFSCDSGEIAPMNKFYAEGTVEIDRENLSASGSLILSTQMAGFDSDVVHLGAQEFAAQLQIIEAGVLMPNELIAFEGFLNNDKNQYFKIVLDFKDNFPSRVRISGTQFRSVCMTK